MPDPASLRFSATDLDVGRETLELYFKALLARQLYGARAAYPLFNRVDPAFMESLSLWEQAHELALLRQ